MSVKNRGSSAEYEKQGLANEAWLRLQILTIISIRTGRKVGAEMKGRLIFATKNKHKMREIHQILDEKGYEILSMEEAGIDLDVVEDGHTFEENALIKARTIRDYVKDAVVLADDSGLEVDYLDGAPGIYSARWQGENTPYSVKNQLLLQKMEGVPEEERTARFVCAMAAAFPDGTDQVVRGTIEGLIGYEAAGENGFGYDPVFFVPEYKRTTAEMTPEQKNTISHRGQALCMISQYL